MLPVWGHRRASTKCNASIWTWLYFQRRARQNSPSTPRRIGSRRAGGNVSACEKEIEGMYYLVDILALPDKFIHRPLGQHAKFGCHKAYFAGSSPDDGRCPTIRDKFLEFLYSLPFSRVSHVTTGITLPIKNVESTSPRRLHLRPSWAFAAR
jgi:hypothetical protein